MKKVIVLSLMLAGSILVLPGTEAKAASASAAGDPQIRVQIGQNRRNRRWRNTRVRRTVTTTRIRRIGRNRFRETIRVTYLPNGRTRTQIIRRQRL